MGFLLFQLMQIKITSDTFCPIILIYSLYTHFVIPYPIFMLKNNLRFIMLVQYYSQFHQLWQSFIMIGSCSHLTRIISRYVGNTKRSRSLEDVKLDNQLWGVKRTLSYFLLVANSKTIHLPNRCSLRNSEPGIRNWCILRNSEFGTGVFYGI